MSPQEASLHERLTAAADRIRRGNEERTAGADDKARAIAAEVERRGAGGARDLAAELGYSQKTISQAVSRAKRAPCPAPALPLDTLARLLRAELHTVPPLPAHHWQAVARAVQRTAVDTARLDHLGAELAAQIEDGDTHVDTAKLREACRAWSRVQALAVVDACQRGHVDALPTTKTAPRSQPESHQDAEER